MFYHTVDVTELGWGTLYTGEHCLSYIPRGKTSYTSVASIKGEQSHEHVSVNLMTGDTLTTEVTKSRRVIRSLPPD